MAHFKQFSRLNNLRQLEHAQTVHSDKQELNNQMMGQSFLASASFLSNYFIPSISPPLPRDHQLRLLKFGGLQKLRLILPSRSNGTTTTVTDSPDDASHHLGLGMFFSSLINN
jgi:hypothetical protein